MVIESDRSCLTGIVILLSCLAAVQQSHAQERKLTDLEIYQMDSTAKDFAIDLIDARVWTKDSDEYRQFRRYAPKDTVRVAVYDIENRRFSDTRATEMTGAEYRRALATARAIQAYARLDDDAKARINQEIYGQATVPERGTEAHTQGRRRIANLAGIIGGEAHARPAESSRPPMSSKDAPKDSTKDTKPGGGRS